MSLKRIASFFRAPALCVCMFAGVAGMAAAQTINPKFEIGASGSGFVYQGDLSNTQLGNAKDVKFGAGIFARYYLSPAFSIRANYYWGSLRGDDTEFDKEWRKKRAYKFKSPLNELSLVLEADIFGRSKFCSYWNEGRHDRRWSLYAFAGVGVAFVNAERDWSGLDRGWFVKDATDNIPLDSVNAPDKNVLIVPVGLGLRYDLSKHTSLFTELGYRITFTDNLDGYKYAVYSPKNDGYTVLSVGISFRLNSNERHDPCAPRKHGPVDTDKDGIANALDSCYLEAGTRQLHGCPDRDHDGVADKYDNCPNDSGSIAMHGCPDRDGDGILDRDDQCPDSVGTTFTNGCPDRDKDGVADKDDQCPDSVGTAKYNGCPIPDTDKDGFNDEVDLCPKAYSLIDNGCPPIKEEVIKAINIAAKNIFFETAKDILRPESNRSLDKVFEILNADETLLADIEGHTDSQGEDAMNMDLSQRRAKVVVDYLVAKGINPARFTHQGFGETRPAADNSTAKGRALNRRTEIKLRNH